MTRREKLVLGVAGLLVLVFAAVALWQQTRTGAAERRLADRTSELALQRQESTLALAAIEASRGSYELARQLASDFFSGLQAQLANAPEEARPELERVLSQRDPMITALSRSDPQAASQLVQLLIRLRIAMGEQVGPRQPSVSAPAGAQPTPADSAPAR